MRVAVLSCSYCDEEWHVPNPADLRDRCRKCGSTLEVAYKEVA